MKNKFLKSTIILLIGGCITKIIGLIIKVLTTRTIGLDGISLLSMINPTYSLLMTLANFNFLVSTSKRISSNAEPKKVIINSCYIMFILNLILIIFMLLSTRFISNNLLKNKATYYPLIACTITLPFISLGYIVKGYFYGKQNVAPHMISNVLEQLLRLFIISTILPKIIKFGNIVTITVLMLINILSESFSIIILLLYIPKNKVIKKEDIKYNHNETKEILSISLPSISGRLLGNIGFFLEPILLTSILLKTGSSINYITEEYGIYNVYVIGTLLFPSFIISAISNSLLPEISKHQATNNSNLIKKRIKESLLMSFIIGLICTIIIFFGAELILRILYDTDKGLSYIKLLCPFFILYYLESPLCSILTGLNKIKTCTIISTTGIIFKLLIMIILGLFHFKIYSLIIAEIFDIVYVTLLNYLALKKELSKKSPKISSSSL